METAQTQPSLNRARDCFIKRRALEMWLEILTPLRWFTDELILISTSPWASNACYIGRQSITVTGNSSPIRVNCIRFGSTDVTITDVTANPALCAKPTYECQ
jgi:hypothetical protein